MNFPQNLKYTKDHEWIRVDRNTGVVGITDYAQSELGDVVFLELPQKGKQVKQGEAFGTIEAVKAVSDLYSPVTGEVIDVNTELQKSPELVNEEPYDRGWMIKVKIADPKELAKLMDSEAYQAVIGK